MKKTKKFLSIILAILMVTSIIPLTASASDDIITGTDGQDITWELNRTTGILTFSGEGMMKGGYNSSSTPKWTNYKSSIKKVVINSGITSIGAYAFYNCYNITEVSIPNSVNNIQDYAFGYCTGLESITIPYSVGVIQTGAFDGCTNFKDVYYTGARYEWNEIIFDDYNENIWYYPTIHFMVSDGYSWTFDEETGTLTIIDEGAGQIYPYYDERPWENIINDIKHIIIDENIKFVGENAFAYAESLETVTMLGVETIDYNVFTCCHSLKSITVGDKLESIYDSFYDCDKLTYIYYSGTQEQWNNVYLYDYYEVLQEVKVYPSDYVVYSGFGIEGNSSGDTVSWVFDANTYTLTVSCEGMLPDIFSFDEWLQGPFYRFTGLRDWDSLKFDIKKVVVDDGVTYIGYNYFRFLPQLTEVVIPATVTEIGTRAFRTCESITDVYFKGTEEQWKAITVGNENESLLNANIHYNYVECEHVYDKSVITEPSCINYGYTTHICSLCNESYVDNFLKFAECPEYVEVILQPTCTKQGYIAYECPVCHTGYVKEYLEPTHNYEQTVITPPTCTTRGYTTYVCKDCGESVKDDYTASLGHEIDDVIETVEPTCTEQGYKKSTCVRCGAIFKADYVDSLGGHKYEAVSTTAPNCTEQGYTTYECTVCGDSYNDDYVDVVHNCDWKIITEPTCTKEGLRKGVCSICDEEITETISRLGHDYSELKLEYDATCLKDGRKSKECSRCGSKTAIEIIPAKGHSYGEWEQVTEGTCKEYVQLKRVCADCGQTNMMSAQVEHDYSIEYNVIESTCTTAGSRTVECSRCGVTKDEIIPATGHNYSSEITIQATHLSTGIETFTCTCGDNYTETIEKLAEHNYNAVVTAPTCTDRGYTTYNCECGDSYVGDYTDAAGHNYSSEIKTPATHTTTGVMTYTCSCGDTYTETIEKLAEHNYNAVVTAPTCTEQGYTTYTCECGDSYVDDYVDALGHTPVTAVEENYVAPTCTENGSKDVVVYCSVCEEEISRETVTLEATGHDDADNDGYCDNCDEQICDHRCHKTGLAGFFWKISNFFNRIFGLKKYCECGVAHY